MIGLGQAVVAPPVTTADPVDAPGRTRGAAGNGTSGVSGLTAIWSTGRPNTYFGTTCSPRRAGHERAAAHEARLDRDVHRAVAHPHDQHRLVAPVVGVDEVVRVHLHPVERPRSTPARATAGPSGGRWPRAARRSGASPPCRASRVQTPSGVSRRVLHAGLEPDPLDQPEVPSVVGEVLRDLRVVRKVRIGRAASGSPSTPSARARCWCAASGRPRTSRSGWRTPSCRRPGPISRSSRPGSPARPAP